MNFEVSSNSSKDRFLYLTDFQKNIYNTVSRQSPSRPLSTQFGTLLSNVRYKLYFFFIPLQRSKEFRLLLFRYLRNHSYKLGYFSLRSTLKLVRSHIHSKYFHLITKRPLRACHRGSEFIAQNDILVKMGVIYKY